MYYGCLLYTSIVDGGMHQITYYGQMMAMKIPHYRQIKKEKGNGQIIQCHVSGSLCTICLLYTSTAGMSTSLDMARIKMEIKDIYANIVIRLSRP